MTGPSQHDGSSYSLSYQWPSKTVIVHVNVELGPQAARDLADSLLWFAERVETR